jgi:hypothetical protein
MKKLRSEASGNELSCEQRKAPYKWLGDRCYIRIDQKNYKVRPLGVQAFACGWAAIIKSGFCRSDFARPSIDFARPCAAAGRVWSSAVTHRRYNFALRSSKSQNSNRLFSHKIG